MFNIERFHNELAMRLGYERIVNDKRILISVEESEKPRVTLKIQGHGDIKFIVSENKDGVEYDKIEGLHNDVKDIVEAAHQAYQDARKCLF